jgi:hypothetical protein
MNKVVRAAGLIAIAGAALLAASCATSRGSTLATVVGAQAAEKRTPQKPVPKPTKPPEDLKGIEVNSTPQGADVWIDGSRKGRTPVIVEDITPGWHRIIIRKDGYYEANDWVQYVAPAMVYDVDLQQIVGFLQVTAAPPGSEVTVGGDRIDQDITTVPIGDYTVRVRAFGYVTQEQTVTVLENALTTLSVALAPAPFAVTGFSLGKKAVNPANPGVLGTLEYDVSVTGPGSGSIRVVDAAGTESWSRDLPPFAAWDQHFSWDLRGADGTALADGTYTMTLSAAGADGENPVSRTTTFTVDRSLMIAYRAVWSGSSGLLYAPVAESLPSGDFQVDLAGAGVAAGPLFEVPVLASARFGLGSGLEIDAMGGVIATTAVTPVMGSLAARWNLVSPRGAYGTGMAVQAKLSVAAVPEAGTVLVTDTFANFTGLSVEVPFQVTLDHLDLLLSAGAAGSFWYPYRVDAGGSPSFGMVGWLYLRAGVMLDMGEFTAGISASTRTEPLPGGISLLSSPIPFEAGAEVHWLVPGTRLVLSALAAGEYQDSSNYYFMGGVGLGFLY